MTWQDIILRYQDECLPGFITVNLNDINHHTYDDDQPLHVACTRGSLEEATILVENGADINGIGDMGYTPLHYAVASGNSELIKYLLSKGADQSLYCPFCSDPFESVFQQNHHETAMATEDEKRA